MDRRQPLVICHYYPRTIRRQIEAGKKDCASFYNPNNPGVPVEYEISFNEIIGGTESGYEAITLLKGIDEPFRFTLGRNDMLIVSIYSNNVHYAIPAVPDGTREKVRWALGLNRSRRAMSSDDFDDASVRYMSMSQYTKGNRKGYSELKLKTIWVTAMADHRGEFIQDFMRYYFPSSRVSVVDAIEDLDAVIKLRGWMFSNEDRVDWVRGILLEQMEDANA